MLWFTCTGTGTSSRSTGTRISLTGTGISPTSTKSIELWWLVDISIKKTGQWQSGVVLVLDRGIITSRYMYMYISSITTDGLFFSICLGELLPGTPFGGSGNDSSSSFSTLICSSLYNARSTKKVNM